MNMFMTIKSWLKHFEIFRPSQKVWKLKKKKKKKLKLVPEFLAEDSYTYTLLTVLNPTLNSCIPCSPETPLPQQVYMALYNLVPQLIAHTHKNPFSQTARY